MCIRDSRKGYIHSYAWNKIYKRSLWKSLRFPEGRWYEDVFTIPAVLRQARYILRSDKGLYYYCSRQGSISNTFCDKGINDLLQANLTLYRTLSDNTNLNDKDLDDAYLHLCDHQIIRIQFGLSLIHISIPRVSGIALVPYANLRARLADSGT